MLPRRVELFSPNSYYYYSRNSPHRWQTVCVCVWFREYTALMLTPFKLFFRSLIWTFFFSILFSFHMLCFLESVQCSYTSARTHSHLHFSITVSMFHSRSISAQYECETACMQIKINKIEQNVWGLQKKTTKIIIAKLALMPNRYVHWHWHNHMHSIHHTVCRPHAYRSCAKINV